MSDFDKIIKLRNERFSKLSKKDKQNTKYLSELVITGNCFKENIFCDKCGGDMDKTFIQLKHRIKDEIRKYDKYEDKSLLIDSLSAKIYSQFIMKEDGKGEYCGDEEW